jgi:hypothetical protein
MGLVDFTPAETQAILRRAEAMGLIVANPDGRDPAARLQRLLDSGELSPATLRDLADDALAPQSPALPRGDAPPAPPPSTARYQVGELLGAGGAGEVWKAFDRELGRPVALKVLHPGASFRREAQLQARVDHPNVCKVHEVGQAGERPFIVMQFIDGRPLTAVAAAMTRDEKLAAAIAICDALAAAHALGLIHRDLKPGNILVERLEHGWHPYVCDFGIATEIGAAGSTGQLCGTPHYMAPEQIGGGRGVDARADVYGLGATLYAFFGGRPPFDGPVADVLTRVLHDEPPDLARVDRSVPRDLATLIHKCLDKRPERRYESARSLGDDLVRCRAGLPLAAHAPGLVERLGRRLRRRGATFGGVAVGAVGVAVALSQTALRRPAAAVATCLQPAGPDLYVDAAAAPGGTGSAACPLRTITAALDAPGTPKVIHVARGTYDHALGERFPLVVRGAVSVVGAGAGETRIVGAGTLDNRAVGGTLSDHTRDATMVVGDEVGPVRIADLGLGPGPGHEGADNLTHGLVCDRGNLSRFDAPPPAANVVAERLEVGPGYLVDIVMGTQTRPRRSGCNFRLAGSRVRGGVTGAMLVGCGTTEPDPVPVPVRLEAEGNIFSQQEPNALRSMNGMGIQVWDCVAELVVRKNFFEDLDNGVYVIRHSGTSRRDGAPGPPPMVIDDNSFRDVGAHGVWLDWGAELESLSGNTFSQVPAKWVSSGAAVLLHAEGGDAPAIRRARGNHFFKNRVAILVQGEGPLPILDFGRPGDPGGNELVCNGAGLLVEQHGTRSWGFAGNAWDRAPPDARDLLLPAAPAPEVDVSAARVAANACRAP